MELHEYLEDKVESLRQKLQSMEQARREAYPDSLFPSMGGTQETITHSLIEAYRDVQRFLEEQENDQL